MKYASFVAPLVCSFTVAASAQNLDSLVGPQSPGLVDTYKSIHAHPELSHHEERTAGILAAELRKAGYAVTERVGKYPDGSQACGVVGILEKWPWPETPNPYGHGRTADRRANQCRVRQPRND